MYFILIDTSLVNLRAKSFFICVRKILRKENNFRRAIKRKTEKEKEERTACER